MRGKDEKKLTKNVSNKVKESLTSRKRKRKRGTHKSIINPSILLESSKLVDLSCFSA